MVYKVEIIPSEYGMKQMATDLLSGPPSSIFENKTDSKQKRLLKIKKQEKKNEKKIIPNKVKALENDEDFEFDEMELRKYERQKMKYYFAVVY